MVLPAIVPTGFDGDYKDFLKVKCDRSGAVRRTSGAVTIPDATTADTIIGLFPFNSGMSLSGLGGYNFHITDIDTASNVTLDIGVAYQDTAAGTDALTLITSGATTPQSGGFVAPDETTWMDYVTTGNGWVVAQVNATTTEAGTITFNVPFAYDQPDL